MLNYQAICQDILQGLLPRQRQVVERRFGLTTEEPLTLQTIGEEMEITRERVRQLVNDALIALKAKEGRKLNKPFQQILDYLEPYGGLREEAILLEDLGGARQQNYVLLFLNLGDDFEKFKETDDFFPLWAVEESRVKRAGQVVNKLIKEFEKAKLLMEIEEMAKRINFNLNKPALISYIDISKHIFQSPFGLYGLAVWPEVRPRGLKDSAYLVLKQQERPLHFREIAEFISQLPTASGKVLPESVHNELIRNDNFVLIGRGTYALKEWGYQPGTVKEVIKNVLKQAKKPLAKEEIVKKVLEQRKVKESTVLLNLQDKKQFRKNRRGKYGLIRS